MLVNLKRGSTLVYFTVCALSCSLLAPPDDELISGERLGPDSGVEAARDATAALDAAPGESDGRADAGNPCNAIRCPANTICRERSGAGTCECSAGFVGIAGACRRATSCDELHTADPELGSGAYSLLPPGSAVEISTYCEMVAEGGGWTLIINQGPSFDPQADSVQALIVQVDAGARVDSGKADSGQPDGGAADSGQPETCYDQDCVSPVYPLVRVRSDVMLDMSDGPIRGEYYLARAVINGIDVRGRGKTLRELFTTGPYFLDNEDNSNVTVRVHSGSSCADALPFEMGNLLCNACRGDGGCGRTVLVFGDSDSACAGAGGVQFAIGAAYTHTAPWGQCAGWPQAPNYSEYNYLPDNYRIWLR